MSPELCLAVLVLASLSDLRSAFATDNDADDRLYHPRGYLVGLSM
jgi:hypothetical protein